MSSKLSVVIVGAGPAGLTAANILARAKITVAVLESDTSVSSRDQGGMLDLHVEDGQVALKKVGLLDSFMAIARHEDQEYRSLDAMTGTVLHEAIPTPGDRSRPEIDRIVLRELLLGPLPQGVVVWDAQVAEVVDTLEGRWAVHLHDGRVFLADLVIGADGAGSVVRSALTSVRPEYTGVTYVELWISDVDRRHPEIARMVGRGTLVAIDQGKAIFAQRNGNAVIRAYAAFKTSEDETNRPERVLSGITKAELLSRFNGWSDKLLRLIRDADHVAAVRPIVSLPPESNWESKPGITLIGDAAHVMPPMGTGVNLAMLDAAEIAEAVAHHADWKSAVQSQEKIMHDRANGLAIQCRIGFSEWFSIVSKAAIQRQDED